MEYRPELDGIRGLAVSSVVLFHSAPHSLFGGGFIGVDVFFVLSSFLITTILMSERTAHGTIDLKRFYVRRLLRLMPALLLFLAGYLCLAPLVWPTHQHHVRDALLAGLYLSDYTYAFWGAPVYLGHTWSLAVEEHFYLAWPFLLILLSHVKRPLPWLAFGWVALTFWRFSYAGDVVQSYYRFDTHATGLILGAALCLSGRSFGRGAGILGLLILIATVLIARFPLGFLAVSLAELGSLLLIGAAGSLPMLRAAPFVWMGKLSYAIYLWHFPIAYSLRTHLPLWSTAGLTFVLALLAAWISWNTVEAWARSIKKRIKPKLFDGIDRPLATQVGS